MKLRFKMNIWVSGFCAAGALIGAFAHAGFVLSMCLFLSWFNWMVGIKGEEKDALS